MSKETISQKIENLYFTSGYMDKYGSDVWAAFIICIVFLVFTFYYYFLNGLQVIKADWENKRCNPLVIPFAGFINKPYDKSNLEFTGENFSDCVNSILKKIIDNALKPIFYVVTVIQDTVNNLAESIQMFRMLIKNIRKEIDRILKSIFVAINNLLYSFIGFFVKVKDSLAKVNGILTTGLYTLFGSYMAMQSLFLVIIDLILIILIAISLFIILFWAIAIAFYGIPFVGMAMATPFGIKAIIVTLIMIAILIPCIIFEVFMLRILDLQTPPPPGVPSCFPEDTPIILFDGSTKKISEINVDDRLINESYVTSILKCSAKDQHMYKLNNVLVTGEHRVLQQSSLKWIKVKNHPESLHIPEFNEPFVYCLNTDKKFFTINGTVFSDWDDIDDNVIADLNEKCVSKGYLPKCFSYTDIHKYLDSGFHATSTVILANGLTIPITDVNVNDVLASGDKVLGLVKIYATDMEIYNFNFDENKSICGSRNIHIDDNNLGIINCMQLSIENKINISQPFLYHLLTDTSFFVINNIRVNDYNSGIDKYLRIE
jgi:hypothetical protein